MPTKVQVQFNPLGSAASEGGRNNARFTGLHIVKHHIETVKISTCLPAGGIIDA